MSGISSVDNELQVGFDEDFEKAWFRVMMVGRIVMIGFVLVCAAGLLGRGPFSHATTRSSDGAIRVDYEPVARNGTPTMVTLHLRNRSAEPVTASVALSSKLVEPLGFQRAVPPPDRSALEASAMRLDYVLLPKQEDVALRLQLQPTGFGSVASTARLADGSAVSWSQFVVP